MLNLYLNNLYLNTYSQSDLILKTNAIWKVMEIDVLFH